MSTIQLMDDAYIDGVIRAAEVYNPNLELTQGSRLRELIKRLRDGDQHLDAAVAQVRTDVYTLSQAITILQDILHPATESLEGIIAIATLQQALSRTEDSKAMTALKTIALILDEKKNVSYQLNPYELNEVSILMEYAGQVNAVQAAGATNVKLKIGIESNYFPEAQAYPFTYAAGDRVFISFAYTNAMQKNCNIKLNCKDY